MPTRLRDRDTILFIGDSIIDCGRREDRHQPLGCGYVSMFNDMLLVRDSGKRIRVLNRGIGGNTVEDLRSRWSDDALAHRPDWLAVGTGINDLNRFLCDKAPLAPENYREIYAQILSATRQVLPGCRLLLIDSFYGSTDTLEYSYRAKVAALLPDYLEQVRRLAAEYGALHLKLHEIFQAKLKTQPAEVYFPNEPVHPLSTGHFLIAESVYQILSEQCPSHPA